MKPYLIQRWLRQWHTPTKHVWEKILGTPSGSWSAKKKSILHAPRVPRGPTCEKNLSLFCTCFLSSLSSLLSSHCGFFLAMAVNSSSTSVSMAATSFQIKCPWPRDSGSKCHSRKLEAPSTRLLSLSIHGLESSQLGPPWPPAQQMAAMVKWLCSSLHSRLEPELCGYDDGEIPD